MTRRTTRTFTGTICCPICRGTARVVRGKVRPHTAEVIRSWSRNRRGAKVMADITVVCEPKITVVTP